MPVIVFNEYWVVKRKAQEDKEGFPLAFLVHKENNSARKKQLETARRWGSEGHEELVIENEPVEGFRLSRSVRRWGWHGSGNVLWRLEDPRGWEFEISSEAFSKLLINGKTTDGIINNKCIYGREGSQNVLVPEGSEYFKDSKSEQTFNLEKKELKETINALKKTLEAGTIISKYSTNWRTALSAYLGRVKVHFQGEPKPVSYYAIYDQSKYADEQEFKTVTLYRSFTIKKHLEEKLENINLDLTTCIGYSEISQIVGVRSGWGWNRHDYYTLPSGECVSKHSKEFKELLSKYSYNPNYKKGTYLRFAQYKEDTAKISKLDFLDLPSLSTS